MKPYDTDWSLSGGEPTPQLDDGFSAPQQRGEADASLPQPVTEAQVKDMLGEISPF